MGWTATGFALDACMVSRDSSESLPTLATVPADDATAKLLQPRTYALSPPAFKSARPFTKADTSLKDLGINEHCAEMSSPNLTLRDIWIATGNSAS